MRFRVGKTSLELWLPFALAVVWWFSSLNSSSVYFPPLRKILDLLWNELLLSRFGSDVYPSLVRFVVGTGLGVACGAVLGIAIGLVPTLKRASDPFVDFLRSLPGPALVPIGIVMLGIGDTMKIAIIAFGTFWPVLLNAIDGVRSVDALQIEMSRVYGLSRRQKLTRVVIPSTMPQIFVGARLSVALGLVLMVISEMMASTNGLGHYVLFAQQTFAIPEMWAGIVLLGIIGYAANALFLLVERRVLGWHFGWRATAGGAVKASGSRKRRRAIAQISRITSGG